MLAETKLGDLDRALAVWRRMCELAPGYDRAREAQKRILQKTKQWDQMVPLLVDEAERAEIPEVRIDVLHRLARLHAEKLGDADNATAVCLQILSIDPREPVALRSVVETYEKQEKWADLAPLLQSQIENAENEAEKISLLRRVLDLQMEKLGDLPAASLAATQILKFIPGDSDALMRLETILEQSGDKPRLVKMLEYHLRYAPSADEKLQIIKRIAGLLQDADRRLRQGHPLLGEVRQARARRRAGLGRAAGGLREASAAWRTWRTSSTSRSRPRPTIRRRRSRPCAAWPVWPAASSTSRAAPRTAWEALLKLQPTDREALEALSAIAADLGDHAALADFLQRRIAIAAHARRRHRPGPRARAPLRGGPASSPAEAIAALEQIINEMDPANVAAHKALRRVAESVQDWPRVVAVAERHLALTTEPKERVARGLEIGWLCRERLADTAQGGAVPSSGCSRSIPSRPTRWPTWPRSTPRRATASASSRSTRSCWP